MTDVQQFKRCGRCHADKPLDSRYFSRRTEESYKATSWRSVCIKCQTARKRALDEAAKKKTHKTCTACRESLPIGEFYVCRKNRDGRQGSCKTCDALRSTGEATRGEVNGEKPAAWTEMRAVSGVLRYALARPRHSLPALQAATRAGARGRARAVPASIRRYPRARLGPNAEKTS